MVFRIGLLLIISFYIVTTYGLENPALPFPGSVKKHSFSGNFDLTNNYIFRGISNSNNNPAVQGGFTYTYLPMGLYANIWATNVDFFVGDERATVEFDEIIGLANHVGDVHFDISLYRYNYPRASAGNYNELVTVLTYSILSATFGYSNNVFGSHETGIYYNGILNIPVKPKYFFGLSDVIFAVVIGRYELPKNTGLLSYTEYQLGVQKNINHYELSLQWIDTNHQAHLAPLDTGHLAFTALVNF